jgi:hypothetical protein
MSILGDIGEGIIKFGPTAPFSDIILDKDPDTSGKWEAFSGARKKLRNDFNKLIDDFSLGIGDFRKEDMKARLDESDKLRAGLEESTENFLTKSGPINESTKARLRFQMKAPVINQLLDFNLGSYDGDISMMMGALQGTMALERERDQLDRIAQQSAKSSKMMAESFLDAQPGKLERILGRSTDITRTILPFAV